MISDKNSVGYKLAVEVANVYKEKGLTEAKAYYLTHIPANMKIWEAAAVLDTYQELIKL